MPERLDHLDVYRIEIQVSRPDAPCRRCIREYAKCRAAATTGEVEKLRNSLRIAEACVEADLPLQALQVLRAERGRKDVHTNSSTKLTTFSQGHPAQGTKGDALATMHWLGRVPLPGRSHGRTSHERDVRVRWPRGEAAAGARLVRITRHKSVI